MGFILILMLSALSIAGSAAFFSIYGLAQIFSGSFWPVVVMASSLEVGKLVAASYVYRYWKSVSITMKAYLMTSVFILMVITSAGIFGFLSAAYQQDMLPMKQMAQEIVSLSSENEQLEQLKIERLDRKKQIDADIASLPNNYIKGRQRLMESYGPELEQLKLDIAEYTATIRTNTSRSQELQNATLEQEAHTGPIIFIAKVFDKEVDDTTKYLILLIIFAFDPLAVALTLATNHAMAVRREEKENARPHTKVIAQEPTKPFEFVKVVEPESETHAPNEPLEVEEKVIHTDPVLQEIAEILDQPDDKITIEQIEEALQKMQLLQGHDMTAQERMFQEMLQQQLAKKRVKEQIRKG